MGGQADCLNKILRGVQKDPHAILTSESLPVIPSLNSVETFGIEKHNSKEIQKSGLFHSGNFSKTSWIGLIPESKTRTRSQEEGILVNFMPSDDNLRNEDTLDSSKRIEEGSSDEFEFEIQNPRKTTPNSAKLKCKTNTPSKSTGVFTKATEQASDSNWLSRPKGDNNKLKSGKGKRRLQLIFPLVKSTNNGSKSTSAADTIVEAETQPMNCDDSDERVDNYLGTTDSHVNKDVGIDQSPDNDIEVLLEVQSVESSPRTSFKPNSNNKRIRSVMEDHHPICRSPGKKSNGSPSYSSDEPVLPPLIPKPKVGTCPLCNIDFAIAALEQHASNCEGPQERNLRRGKKDIKFKEK